MQEKKQTAKMGGAEKMLLEGLAAALRREGRKADIEKDGPLFFKMAEIARRHAVLPLLAALGGQEDPESWEAAVRNPAKVVVRSNYRLLFLTKYVTRELEKNGIRAIVLKGAATASYYPTPELRKSGDVDILIPDRGEFLRAANILKEDGFKELEGQTALHHLEMVNEEGISVEIHSMLAEPFESRKMNQYLEELAPEYGDHMVLNEAWGVPFYQPSDAYHAFYLIVHMLQHFLRAGFGLKFLCDWVVFWDREVRPEEKEVFLRLVKESGTEGFVRILDGACVRYLGLREDRAVFRSGGQSVSAKVLEDFMEEVFAAGEFGHDESQRMVAMRGTGLNAYVREFHHQMHLNYPSAGKVFLLWPALWAATLARFLHNNRAVRKVKGREILKKAGKRSRLIGRMKLFS